MELRSLYAAAETAAPILVDAAIKGSLLLLVAPFVTGLARRGSAATRHFVWTLTAAGLLALPVLSAVLPAVPLIPRTVGTVAATRLPESGMSVATGDSFDRASRSEPLPEKAQSEPSLPEFALNDDSRMRESSITNRTATVTNTGDSLFSNPVAATLVVWLTGCTILLAWLVAGVLRAASLCRRSRSVSDPQLLAGWDKARAGLGVRRRVTLSAGDAVSMPMTVGVLRPRVLLPAEALHWPVDRLRVVLLHELAHVKRRDCLTQLLASFACALYWFYPLAWFALRRVRIEAEQASDDLVLSTDVRPSDYARQLLAVCVEHAAVVRCPAAVGMARPSRIAGRLQRILDDDSRRRSLTRRSFVMGTCLAVAVVVPLAMATGRAEEPAGTDGAASKRTSQDAGNNGETGVAAKDDEADDNEAQNKALAVHRAAAMLHQQPRLSLRWKIVSGDVATMQNVADRSPERLKEALSGTVPEEHQNRGKHEVAWDENHFLASSDYHFREEAEGDPRHRSDRFWTRTQAWERQESGDGRRFYVLLPSPDRLWESVYLSYSYLLATPRKFWWGEMPLLHQLGSTVPPENATYVSIGIEEFGGEPCDVVEATGRQERLWISRESGRLRGVLYYIFQGRMEPFHESDAVKKIAGRTFASREEYRQWHEEATNEQHAQLSLVFNETYFATMAKPFVLTQFDDYREVAPGVWLPFREVSASALHGREDESRYRYTRSEVTVEEATTDVDLAPRFPPLMPKDGDQVQDQRYGVAVNYEYRADRTKEEILELVAAEKQEMEEGQKVFEEMIKPLQALVGKPAPALPAEGWIGGEAPEIDGKPYLIHFWATWCGPCKNDYPLLNELAKNGTPIVGLHPAGTPAEDVQKAIADEELGYPTFLATDEQDRETIAGYPAKLFPYCVIVDDTGRIAGHGRLGPDLMAKFRALKQPADDRTAE